MELEMPVVETKRLVLRPIEMEDASDVYAYYKEPETMKYLTLQPHASIDDTIHSIKTYFLSYRQRCVPQTWVMVLKTEDKVIGNLNIHTIEDDIGEIGYLMHPNYWNKGLMSEAIQALVKVAFEEIGLRRLEAYYEVEHDASGKVLTNCGFIAEGILRQYAKLNDGLYHDMKLVSILKDEYKKEGMNDE